jgi:cell division septation protein DedD
VVLFPETRDGRDATSVTALRLDGGYLRVIIQGQTAHNRFEVSSARWQAQLQNGEYVFDSQGAESSVCTLSGAMRLSGLPDGVDMPQARGCVHLSGQAVQVVTLTSADWALVEKRRSLLPALAQVGDRPRDAAVASRDESGSLLKMPKTRFVPARVPPPVSLARVDAMIERLDRWIAQQQALLADELIASTPTTLGLSQTLASAPPPVPPLSPDVPADAESRGEWIINIDTYPSQETAELQAAKLRAQDIQASIRSETVRGRSSYRVVVEGLASEGDANAVRDRLVSTLGMRQAWVFRKH